jgi:hypothetical protein
MCTSIWPLTMYYWTKLIGEGGILRHNYNFCCSMIEGNVWTWAHIYHKVMHTHLANLRNPRVLGALGVR